MSTLFKIKNGFTYNSSTLLHYTIVLGTFKGKVLGSVRGTVRGSARGSVRGTVRGN